MEGYANRDSVPYKELYGLKDCTRLIRGTLRYPGHCALMAAMKAIGLASEDIINQPDGTNWFTYLSDNLKFESPKPNYLPSYHLPKISHSIHSKIPYMEIEDFLSKCFNKIFA